jgi:SNF2 family DNA or RNA helicase
MKWQRGHGIMRARARECRAGREAGLARLEDLAQGAAVRGILPDELVTVVNVQWYGSDVIELTYKSAAGKLGSELVFRDREAQLEIAERGRPWSFDGDGRLLRLVSEAYRIHLAYLFDPLLAVHTSLVDPLPHQITAVYEEMLPRQPLRFLLADDPGAGKTIMTGLLIKELLIRGDLHRCLIVCPGSLVEQWQDELYRRFHLNFSIVTRDSIETSRSGNPFAEQNLLIGRLDHLSRNEDIQAKLEQTDWDLIVCDEAHKMSASYFSGSGGEVKETKRYKLGKLLAGICRNFLLLTATPHNGKEEDFQLFMALLDGDRFEGKFRDGVHQADTSDLMRRMVKEQLLKFDGKPLFPERLAYTVNYTLTDEEAALYSQVTEYVRDEMNRADRLAKEGQGRRSNNVGFALTILQRRLASSPEAIFQSLKRRRERLLKRLREEQIQKRGSEIASHLPPSERYGSEASFDGTDKLRTIKEENIRYLTEEDLEDLEDAPESEVEQIEEMIADTATAAANIQELRAEIDSLARLEKLALKVRQSGSDRKWEELSKLLQGNPEMFDPQGSRRKLIIFTEHRDTLNYLKERIGSVLGRQEAVVTIQGNMGREERRRNQEDFTQNPDVQILVATDAAGEGVNLQRAHLMVNYDLPWNPNRLEQRFGRIHRIGQTEVCHLWNLVANETREGEVFLRLFEKLEEERNALGGKVFDVLGKVFGDQPLRTLLIEAIRYGDKPEVRERLNQVVDQALDRGHIQELLEERALARDSMDARKLMAIKEDMERAEARRLQPYFIASFFLEAFKLLGGSVRERETGRYEISHVPALIRGRDRQIGTDEPVLSKYERITFEKDLISVRGKPLAAFVCPGHALLDATIDLILERHRDLLKRGAVLVDPNDAGTDVRALVYLEHSVQDARVDSNGNRRVVSKRVEFVELDSQTMRDAGPAPYLDYRPIDPEERAAIDSELQADWLRQDLESRAVHYAAFRLVPDHLREVRERREEMVRLTMSAVKERLTKEINYWDMRAAELREQEQAGRQPKMNSEHARRRADDLQERFRHRMEELEQERQVSAQPPIVVGGALIVPAGALRGRLPSVPQESEVSAEARAEVEQLAMNAVMEAERLLGREPRDVSAERLGYDIESRVPENGRLLFIEVKGRQQGADTITVTKNEILTALNTLEDFVLALVEVDGAAREPKYLRQPFRQEPDFEVTSVNYKLQELLARAETPA